MTALHGGGGLVLCAVWCGMCVCGGGMCGVEDGFLMINEGLSH